jgi:DNA-binding SARP family transcriptional activator
VRYRILGPLSVTDGVRDVAVTAGRDRVVLAMLLLSEGRIVGVDELIDAVWADDPPTTARGQLQTCVSRLRRTLPDTITTDAGGWVRRTGRSREALGGRVNGGADHLRVAADGGTMGA